MGRSRERPSLRQLAMPWTSLPRSSRLPLTSASRSELQQLRKRLPRKPRKLPLQRLPHWPKKKKRNATNKEKLLPTMEKMMEKVPQEKLPPEKLLPTMEKMTEKVPQEKLPPEKLPPSP